MFSSQYYPKGKIDTNEKYKQKTNKVQAIYLTLEKRKEQQQMIEALLNRENIPHNRYIPNDDPKDCHKERVHKSHIQMLHIVSGWGNEIDALILEDDAFWESGKLLSTIDQIREEWKDVDWDVMVIGSGLHDICSHAIELKETSGQFARSGAGCHAYIVRSSKAPMLIDIIDRSEGVCIEKVNWPSDFKVITVMPSFVIQNQKGKDDGRFHWTCKNGKRIKQYKK